MSKESININNDESYEISYIKNNFKDQELNNNMKALNKRTIYSRNPFTIAYQQISGLIYKNLLIKLHNFTTTLFEIFFNLIVIILYSIRQVNVNGRNPNPTSEFGGALSIVLQLIPFISYGTFKVVTQQILEEKNNRMIENLKILGMRDQNYTLALLLTEVVIAAFIGVANLLILQIYKISVINDLILLVFAFILQSLGIASFSLMLSTLFSSPLAAVIVNALIIYWPGIFYNWIATFSDGWKYFQLLNPVISFMALFGEQVPETGVSKFEMPIWRVWTFIGSSVVYFQLLQLYLDSSVSNDYGVKKDAITDIFYDGGVDFKYNPKWPIQVKKLTKIFGNKTIGLNEMTIKIPSNQVTCILGHNGAGKTTLINILTGMFEQSKGYAYIYGKPTKDFMSELRLYFGVCPQFDILFDGLTVYEHIQLCHNLKGLLYDHDLIIQLLKITQLDEHCQKKAWQLSGGMKRMLSLTIALIGDPDIIFMDEPTSAMDAEIRSKLRKVIRTLGKTKTIVLTTQHMDEAEELADKIALMSKGRLHTWGEVNDIKKKFGAGYNLQFYDLDQDNISKIEETLSKHIKNWTKNEFHDHAENERVYILPIDQIDKFAALLTELETLKHRMSIEMSSLEESFINFHINELKEEADTFNDDADGDIQEIADTEYSIDDKMVIDPSFLQHNELNVFMQILAILERKFKVSRREYITIFSVALPGFLIFLYVLIMALTGVMNVSTNDDPYEIQWQMKGAADFYTIFTSQVVNISYAFGCAHIIFNIVRDRVENTRQLQNAKGMLTIVQWFSNILADFIIQLIPLVLVFIQFRISGIDFFEKEFWTLIAQYSCQGLHLISITQALSQIFSSQISAYQSYGWIMFFVFYVAFVLCQVMLLIFKADQSILLDYFDQQMQVLCSSPSISFLISTQFTAYSYFLSFDPSTIDNLENRLIVKNDMQMFKASWPSQNILFTNKQMAMQVMLCYSFLYISICITIDQYRLNNFRTKDNSEIKYRDEWKELPYDDNLQTNQLNNLDNCSVHIKGVSKTQSNVMSDQFTALSDVSLSIKPGEIFGLLGPNGAGKSTFFNIATMNETRSLGEVSIFGEKIESNMADTYLNTGIAPQPNYLFESQTVQEHLWYQSSVKGLSLTTSKIQINWLIHQLDLSDQRDSKANELSGGNKRKLMCAIALLSCPKLVFLDEPTTGVDPVARMKLRKTIKSFAKFNNSTQIYTTHYMHEAEQICDRVAILINGKLIVVSTIEDLRRKQGSGFTVSLYFTDLQDKKSRDAIVNQYMDTINQQKPELDNKLAKNDREIVLKISQDNIKFGLLFQSLLQLKTKGDINEFVIEKSNLEHIFLYFARFQNEIK